MKEYVIVIMLKNGQPLTCAYETEEARKRVLDIYERRLELKDGLIKINNHEDVSIVPVENVATISYNKIPASELSKKYKENKDVS